MRLRRYCRRRSPTRVTKETSLASSWAALLSLFVRANEQEPAIVPYVRRSPHVHSTRSESRGIGRQRWRAPDERSSRLVFMASNGSSSEREPVYGPAARPERRALLNPIEVGRTPAKPAIGRLDPAHLHGRALRRGQTDATANATGAIEGRQTVCGANGSASEARTTISARRARLGTQPLVGVPIDGVHRGHHAIAQVVRAVAV
jgi:hypothetical protein